MTGATWADSLRPSKHGSSEMKTVECAARRLATVKRNITCFRDLLHCSNPPGLMVRRLLSKDINHPGLRASSEAFTRPAWHLPSARPSATLMACTAAIRPRWSAAQRSSHRARSSCVMTFEPHPRDYFAASGSASPRWRPARIATLRDSYELAACGVDQAW